MSFEKMREKAAGTPARHGKTRDELTAYLEGTSRPSSIGISLPPKTRVLELVLNWPGLVVNTVEARLDVEGFLLADGKDTDDDLWKWWQTNDLDLESSLLHRETLGLGRGFVIVGNHPEEGIPAITVHTEVGMAVRVDPITREVAEAVRCYKDGNDTEWAAHYLPGQTDYYYKSMSGYWLRDGSKTIRHASPLPAVVPFVNRARIGDYTGRSEMADVLGLTDAACRTLTNMQLAQELLGAPLRGLFGVDSKDLEDANGNPVSAVDLYMGRLLTSENDQAKIMQLAGADLRNFTEVIQTYARQVSILTGIPQHYLGLGTDNPTSSDAMRAAENQLVKRVERHQRVFGEAWEKVMRVALAHQGKKIDRATRLETVWRDAATPTMAAKMDAAVKGKEAGLYGADTALKMAGFSLEERRAAALERIDPMTNLGLGAPKPGEKPNLQVVDDLGAMGVGDR